ncbi:hypothetical protein BBP40_010898, partial [Aspergillus hancockii]
MGMPGADPNPSPKVRARDILSVATFLVFHVPWTILRATLYHLTSTPDRPPFLKDLTRSLVRTFEHLPLNIHNSLPDTSGSSTLSSPRYAPLKHNLFHKIPRQSFTGYWVCRGLSPSTLLDPKDADLVIYYLRGSGYALGHPAGNLPELLFLAELLEKKGKRVCVFSLDYTLAQNGAFPTQVLEAVGAYRYLVGEVGVRPERVCLV